MGDFFDTMTIVVVIIMVFLVLVIAIHASARLVQMTFVPFTKKNTLLVNRWQSGHRSV